MFKENVLVNLLGLRFLLFVNLLGLLYILLTSSIIGEDSQCVRLVREKPHYKYIVERARELKELETYFYQLSSSNTDGISVVYLTGKSGSGKSELARQYGNFVYGKSENSNVITLNTESENEFKSDLVTAILELKNWEVDSETWKWSDYKNMETKNLTDELRGLLLKRPVWLLIVDDIKDPEIKEKDIYKHLPKPGEKTWGRGQMLVTTQIPLADNDTEHIRIKNTDAGFTSDDAKTFLCQLVRTNKKKCNESAAEEIVHILDNNPDSIFREGIYVKKNMMFDASYNGLNDYLKELMQVGVSIQ